MKLGLPAFERALARRVRAAIRESKDLRREHKRLRRANPRVTRVDAFVRLVLPPAVGLGASALPHHVPLVLLALALYALGTALLRARGLLVGLWASQDLFVLTHQPAADEDLFALQWTRFRRGAGWIVYACVAVYAALALVRKSDAGAVAAAVGLGLAQGFAIVGLSAALAAWRPHWPLETAGKAFCGATILLALFGQQLAPRLPESTGLGLLAVPTGWGSFALRTAVLDGRPWGWLAALPLVPLAGLVVAAGRRLRKTYAVGELIRPAPPPAELLVEHAVEMELVRQSEYNPEIVEHPELKPLLREELRRAVPQAAERDVLSGALSRPPAWTSAGPLERAFAALLSPRGRRVADFLMGGDPRWSRSWACSAAAAGLGVAVALASRQAPIWLLGVLLAVSALLMMRGRWFGLAVVSIGNGYLPHHALYPLGYGEISGILFRAAALRLAAWAPLLLGVLAAAAPDLGLTTAQGLEHGLRGLLLLAAVRPALVVLQVATGTSDGDGAGCARMLYLLPMALALLGAAAGGILSFHPEGTMAAAGIGGVALFSTGAWAFYGRAFKRWRIDLLRATPS